MNKKRSFFNIFSVDYESSNQGTKEKKIRKLDVNENGLDDQNKNNCAKIKFETNTCGNQINDYFSYLNKFNFISHFKQLHNIKFEQKNELNLNNINDFLYFQLKEKNLEYCSFSQLSLKNYLKSMNFNETNFLFKFWNKMETLDKFTTFNIKPSENIQIHSKKIMSNVHNNVLPVNNELIMFMSNYALKERINWSIETIKRKEYNSFKNNSRYLICYPFSINYLLSNFIPSIEHPITALNSNSLNPSIFNNSNKFGWMPSCTKCLLPGFHPKTAWLLPPTFFGRGGRIKRKTGFLKGLPVSLFTTCFSIKNLVTVESTHLFVSTAKKEEYEYVKKGMISLREEKYKESIYYLEDDLSLSKCVPKCLNNIQGSNLNTNRQIKDQLNEIVAQNAAFCGFVSLETKIYTNLQNNQIFESNKSRNPISNYNNIKVNPIFYSNIFSLSHIDEKKFPNNISDCDVLLENTNSNEFYLDKWNLSRDQKITLLIPRLKCVIRPVKCVDSYYTINKPCYLLLWNYNIRNCNNTVKDINWINIQCKFVRLKYFGQAYEASVSINLKPHQEVVLDQLNRIRNIDEAKVFAWILAGCMQYTINELLIDSFTKTLYFGNANFDLQSNINIFNNCISDGTFVGFPESPLDQNGNIKWQILQQLLER